MEAFYIRDLKISDRFERKPRSSAQGVSSSCDDVTADDDDVMSTHSDLPSPAERFKRNDRLRSSLPVVGTPNKSQERPLGLVFLTFRNETKRGLLPNEITSMSTVWALFVRAFSDQLSMAWFERSRCTICILDKEASVYFALRDLRSIRDRGVLKIFEEGDVIPGMELSIRAPTPTDRTSRATAVKSPPPSSRTGMRTPGGTSVGRPQQAPPVCSSPVPGHLSPVPGRHFTETQESFEAVPMVSSDSRSTGNLHETSDRMCKMEHQLASLASMVQHAMIQQQQKQQQHEVRQHSVSSSCSSSSRPASVLSSQSNNSDASQVTVRTLQPHGAMCVDLHARLKQLLHETSALRAELARVRQMHQVQSVLHKDAIYKTFVKIKEAMASLPIASIESAHADLVHAERTIHAEQAYVISNALKELETSVEELRSDVVSRRCDVDLAHVESTTIVLTRIGHMLTEHKQKLQMLKSKMKSFGSSDADLEKLTREEESELEKLLMRWKQLAGTLATLKKLAMVQQNRSMAAAQSSSSGTRHGVLKNTQTNTQTDTQTNAQTNAQANTGTAASKHRSILYKPQLCQPVKEDARETTHSPVPQPSVPLCPQIFINNTPLPLSNPPSPRSSSPSSKPLRINAFPKQSGGNRTREPDVCPQLVDKPCHINRVTDAPHACEDCAAAPHQTCSGNTPIGSGLEQQTTRNSDPLNSRSNESELQQPSGHLSAGFSVDGKTQQSGGDQAPSRHAKGFYAPRRLPPDPPTRKYHGVTFKPPQQLLQQGHRDNVEDGRNLKSLEAVSFVKQQAESSSEGTSTEDDDVFISDESGKEAPARGHQGINQRNGPSHIATCLATDASSTVNQSEPRVAYQRRELGAASPRLGINQKLVARQHASIMQARGHSDANAQPGNVQLLNDGEGHQTSAAKPMQQYSTKVPKPILSKKPS